MEHTKEAITDHYIDVEQMIGAKGVKVPKVLVKLSAGFVEN